MRGRLLALIVLVAGSRAPAWAAVGDEVTVYRTNGVSFQATIVAEDDQTVTFDVVYDTITVPRADIENLVPLGDAPAVPAVTAKRATTKPSTPRPAQPPAQAVEGLNVGNRAPAFEVQDLAGRSQAVGSGRGSVVVLQFWATWCPSCRHSVPILNKVHRRYASQGLRVLAISNEDASTLRRFIEQHDLSYPVITSPDTSRRYGIRSIPATFVIDQDGIIRHRQVGSGEGFLRVVEELL